MKQKLSYPKGQEGLLLFHRPSNPMARTHHHDELEVNLVVSGTSKLLVNNRCYELKPGMMAWLFPKQEHILWEESPNLEMWIAVFSRKLVKWASMAEYYQTLATNDPPGDFCRNISLDKWKNLCDIFQKAFDSCDDKVMVNASLGYILILSWQAFESAQTMVSRPIMPVVRKALMLIDSDDCPPTLEELARKINVSSSYLSRAFRKETHMSLVEFRNQKRIERFIELYTSSGKKINLMQLAMQAGFGSYAQFYRIFTKQIGMTPREYQRHQ